MTAPTIVGMREPTAVVPDRVLILTEADQQTVIQALHYLARGDNPAARRLCNQVAYGTEYWNTVDELARVTLRKRALETAVRRLNGRIAALEEQVVEDLVARGESSVKHAATGATLRLARQVWAKVVREGDKPTDDEKAAAARGLIEAGLGEFVQPGFNTNSISAYFRERVKEYDADQRDLPEHERQPRDAASFLPAELDGLIALDDSPTIRVTAPRR